MVPVDQILQVVMVHLLTPEIHKEVKETKPVMQEQVMAKMVMLQEQLLVQQLMALEAVVEVVTPIIVLLVVMVLHRHVGPRRRCGLVRQSARPWCPIRVERLAPERTPRWRSL